MSTSPVSALHILYATMVNASLVDVANVMVWSTVQLGLAIICCCLPTCGPVFALGGSLVHRFKSLYSSLTRSKATTSSGYSRWVSTKRSNEHVEGLAWQRIDEQSFTFNHGSSNAVAAKSVDIQMTMPAESIGVERAMDVV